VDRVHYKLHHKDTYQKLAIGGGNKEIYIDAKLDIVGNLYQVVIQRDLQGTGNGNPVVHVKVNQSKAESISMTLNNVLEEKKHEEEEKDRRRQVLSIQRAYRKLRGDDSAKASLL
jgi:hypothetical protein